MAKNSTILTWATKLKAALARDKVLVLDSRFGSGQSGAGAPKGEELVIHDFFRIDNTEKHFAQKDISDFDGLAQDVHRSMNLTDMKVKKMDLVYNSAQLQTKIITAPEMDEKDLKEYIEIEMGRAFPNISHTTHVMDYVPLGMMEEEGQAQHAVLLATVPVLESARLLRAFENKKMKVNAIETVIHALGNALWLTEGEEEDKVILHIGKEYSLILFAQNDVPMFYRMFAFGYNQLAREIAGRFCTPLNQIHHALKNHGFSGGLNGEDEFIRESYERTLQDAFATFANEVFRSVNYVKMETKFSGNGMFLSGGMAEMEGIEAFIGNSVGMDVKKWTFSDIKKNGWRVRTKNKEVMGPEYAAAMGLSLRGWL